VTSIGIEVDSTGDPSPKRVSAAAVKSSRILPRPGSDNSPINDPYSHTSNGSLASRLGIGLRHHPEFEPQLTEHREGTRDLLRRKPGLHPSQIGPIHIHSISQLLLGQTTLSPGTGQHAT
jgi:hypothetical protein